MFLSPRARATPIAPPRPKVSVSGVVFFAYSISALEAGGYATAAAGTAALALTYRRADAERVAPAAEGELTPSSRSFGKAQ